MEKKGILEILKGFLPWQNPPPGHSKTLRLAITIGLAGLLFLILGGLGKENKITPKTIVKESITNEQQIELLMRRREREMAKELAGILSHIKGVGRVEVELTLDSGPIQVYEYNHSEEVSILEEVDAGGGKRSQGSTQQQKTAVLMRNAGGQENPLIIKEIQPQVRGVLVIAEGAENAVLKADIARAVSRVLGVPLHRVMVLPY